MTTIYDREYYEKYTESYDTLRGPRKYLKFTEWIIPKGLTAIMMPIDNPNNVASLNRFFKVTGAYDVNEHLIALCREKGLRVINQDCSEVFEPKFAKVFICVSYYLAEHLTDEQYKNLIINMTRSAAVNFIRVTTKDDENYFKDETHINPKDHRGWSKLTGAVYKQLGWKRIAGGNGTFMYGEPYMCQNIKKIRESMSSYLKYKGNEFFFNFKHKETDSD